MKRKFNLLFALITMISLIFFCVGCNLLPSTGDNSTGGGNSGTTPAVQYVKVTFYDNYEGASKTEVKVVKGEKVEKPDDPVREGYAFENWYSDYACTKEFDFDQEITKNAKAYAKWKQEAFEISFKYNNGQADSTVFVELGESLQKPADPVYEGYRFTGWYTDSALQNAYDFNSALTGNLILYAGWSQTDAIVTFDYNYPNAPEASKQTVEIGNVMTAPEDPTRELYAFEGWYTGKGADATKFDFTQAISANVTLYAKWTRSQYMVTFEGNYEGAPEGTKVPVVIGEAVQAPAVERYGYLFDGWYVDAECTTKANLTVSDDTILYANWKKDFFTVTFDLNYAGATGAPEAQTVEYLGKASEPTEPTRSGYTFIAWYTDAACEGTQFIFTDMGVEGEMTLYAKWVETTGTPDKVTITMMYNVEGMGEYTKLVIDYNSRPNKVKPADPVVEGYYFDNWYQDAECKTEFKFTSKVDKDITLYARLLKRYTFEAEYVNLKGKNGQGSSVNFSEEGLIADGKLIAGGDVSNGYYLTGLYYNGAFVDFEITAEKEINNAVLALRVSTECKKFKDYVLDSDEFQIIVNGTYDAIGQPTSGALKHIGLNIPEANLQQDGDADPNKTPFIDSIVYEKLHLNAGKNVIRLRVNTKVDYGGTFNAEAPIIDCMYIYADAALTMTEYPEFLNKVKQDAGIATANVAAYIEKRASRKED